jgi:excinuclease UvrABC ATPase subunit
LELIVNGVPERDFGGLKGFFAWLERRKYKMHIRVFLSRWRSYRTCPACNGARLRPEALATRVGGRNLAEVSAMKIRDAAAFFRALELSACPGISCGAGVSPAQAAGTAAPQYRGVDLGQALSSTAQD